MKEYGGYQAQKEYLKNGMVNGTHMPQTRLNVGVVGIGRMGQRHALNLLTQVLRANLLCVCSPAESDLVWADQHLKPYGVQIYSTFEEMIETPGLEAVVISSATALHKEHTIASFDRGIHVLCEKPICTDIGELGTLIDLFETKSEVKLMVAFARRFDDSYQDARAKVQQGAIGRPMVIRSQSCEKFDMSEFYKQYLQACGGIFLDATVHEIDLALFFFGEDSIPKSVSAVGFSAMHTELSNAGDADNAVGICEFWDSKIAFFYNSRTAFHGYDNATEVFGTAGKLSINLEPRRNRVELCDGDGMIKVDALPGWYDRYENAFTRELDAWVNAILDHKPMPIPIRSSLTSLKIATALQESLRTGHKVEFTREGVRRTGSS